MQTHELFLSCTNETLLTHKSLLLAEAKLVDDVLTERRLTSGTAADDLPSGTTAVVALVEPVNSTVANDAEPKQAELGARYEATQAQYKALQQAIDEELGDEIKFVKSLLWHVGGSPGRAAQALQTDNYSVRILTGQSRYENGLWTFQWRPKPESLVAPTPDERKGLAERFAAASKKLNTLGAKIRSGKVSAAVRGRLKEYGLLTKGGVHGRWMCDGLAVEMAQIGRRIA
jgi:hypothetical protein